MSVLGIQRGILYFHIEKGKAVEGLFAFPPHPPHDNSHFPHDLQQFLFLDGTSPVFRISSNLDESEAIDEKDASDQFSIFAVAVIIITILKVGIRETHGSQVDSCIDHLVSNLAISIISSSFYYRGIQIEYGFQHWP